MAASPEPVGHSEIVKGLTHMGYQATDQATHAAVSGLNAVSELSGGKLLKRVGHTGRNLEYQMEARVARQVLGALRGRPL